MNFHIADNLVLSECYLLTAEADIKSVDMVSDTAKIVAEKMESAMEKINFAACLDPNLATSKRGNLVVLSAKKGYPVVR